MALPKLNLPSMRGTWIVTTEGDCEGRTTINLGTFTGWVDEIALYLADKAHYALRFKAAKIPKEKELIPTRHSVQVSFDIETGTWGLDGKDRVKKIREAFSKEGRDVNVEEGRYYATVTINGSETHEQMTRRQALAKLTAEERKALGL